MEGIHLSSENELLETIATPPVSQQEICDLCQEQAEKVLLFRTDVFYPKRKRFEIHSCKRCQLAVTLPRQPHSQTELYQDFRGHEGKRFYGFVEWLIHFAEKNRSREICRFRNPGAVLDVGCGRGLLLYYLKQAGWKAMGTESGEETCRTIQQTLGVPVVAGDFRRLVLAAQRFDGIVLWHVLEHLENPATVLEEARRLLKAEGFLIIALPNFGSLQARTFQGRWFHLSALYHLTHFTLPSLEALTERHGFRITKTKHFFFCHNVYGWLQSFLNLCFKEQDFLFYALQRTANAKNTRAFRLKLFLSLFLSAVFFLPSLVLAVVESLMGQGGTVELWLEKQDGGLA